uniref:Fatty acid desaturase domain-containing protein n=1 Tax=Coccolithus braarudii TaxID=221442 RepID=A0A7S0LKH0_9EUKA
MIALWLSAFENRPQLSGVWVALLLVILAAGRTAGRPFIPYVNIIFPFYVWSMTFGLLLPNPLLAVGGMYVAYVTKVGVCMSVCFHRYASHQAFKCDTLMRSFICTLGCLANQGGPIWWASKHRCHHRYCDHGRDPHSTILDGDTTAFAFFSSDAHKMVEEDFAPPHIDTLLIRIIDTFAIAPVMCELLLAFYLGGPTALYIAAVSGQQSQVISLWFNVVNHPEHDHDAAAERATVVGGSGAVCKGADKYVLKNTPNVLFSMLNRHLWIGALCGENCHGHHHHYAQLAQRPGIDLPYWLFVLPLRSLGLISDAKLLSGAAAMDGLRRQQHQETTGPTKGG